MDKAVLLDHLETARRHAQNGAFHVDQQRRIVAAFIAWGRDATEAQELLALFERTQAEHIAHVNRLLEELEKEGA